MLSEAKHLCFFSGRSARTLSEILRFAQNDTMRWLTVILTFVNLSVACGLLLGMAGRGLNVLSASLALVCGAAFAVAAYLGTTDKTVREKATDRLEAKRKP